MVDASGVVDSASLEIRVGEVLNTYGEIQHNNLFNTYPVSSTDRSYNVYFFDVYHNSVNRVGNPHCSTTIPLSAGSVITERNSCKITVGNGHTENGEYTVSHKSAIVNLNIWTLENLQILVGSSQLHPIENACNL